MKKIRVFLCVMAFTFGLAGSADATLWDRGGGLIFDDFLNLTWLQDTNYAKTSGYDADGAMTWSNAVAWADQLSYGGFDDWRLPTTTVDGRWSWGYNGTTTAGYNITTSEMGHLFYESLGNKGYYATDGTVPQSGWGVTKTGPFSNLKFDGYWSGTEYSLDPNGAWVFGFGYGDQDVCAKAFDGYSAWAVRDGDVAPVPEPATVLLLASGLVGLLGFRKKFRHH